MFSEFHIRRDASYLAPAPMDIKDIYYKPDLNIHEVIHRYFKACPLHQSDSRIGYIVLNDSEHFYLNQHDQIKLSNVDIAALQAGFPDLYQHIYLHQQATDAISFKITSTSWDNDKLDDNWKRDYLSRSLYLAAILIKVDEPQTRNLLPPYRRESSQHQEFELNQPSTSTALVNIRSPSRSYSAEHPWQDQQPGHQQLTSVWSDIDQWTSEQQCSQPRQPLQPRHHLVEGTSPHRNLLPGHVAHCEIARAGYIDIKDNCSDIKCRYLDADNQHRPFQGSYNHHQAQRRHGHRLTSEGTAFAKKT